MRRLRRHLRTTPCHVAECQNHDRQNDPNIDAIRTRWSGITEDLVIPVIVIVSLYPLFETAKIRCEATSARMNRVRQSWAVIAANPRRPRLPVLNNRLKAGNF